eukprot:SAG11_NODE_361_length_10183_cov_4.077053_10_plen_108_part_00
MSIAPGLQCQLTGVNELTSAATVLSDKPASTSGEVSTAGTAGHLPVVSQGISPVISGGPGCASSPAMAAAGAQHGRRTLLFAYRQIDYEYMLALSIFNQRLVGREAR